MQRKKNNLHDQGTDLRNQQPRMDFPTLGYRASYHVLFWPRGFEPSVGTASGPSVPLSTVKMGRSSKPGAEGQLVPNFLPSFLTLVALHSLLSIYEIG